MPSPWRWGWWRADEGPKTKAGDDRSQGPGNRSQGSKDEGPTEKSRASNDHSHSSFVIRPLTASANLAAAAGSVHNTLRSWTAAAPAAKHSSASSGRQIPPAATNGRPKSSAATARSPYSVKGNDGGSSHRTFDQRAVRSQARRHRRAADHQRIGSGAGAGGGQGNGARRGQLDQERQRRGAADGADPGRGITAMGDVRQVQLQPRRTGFFVQDTGQPLPILRRAGGQRHDHRDPQPPPGAVVILQTRR